MSGFALILQSTCLPLQIDQVIQVTGILSNRFSNFKSLTEIPHII